MKAALIAHLGVDERHVEMAVFPGSAEVRPTDALFRALG
jgi:uncharacterized protein (DUF1501 family)